MLLKNKTVFVYDVEVFPNLFTCTIKNTESKVIRSYEISDRKNDLPLIAQCFLNKKIYFCGFNIIHYDSPIISYLILNYKELISLPVWEITKRIYELSNQIINSQDGQFSGWSKYKYANLFDQLDLLTMMFSNKLRVGLKELQVTMEYPNVQEFDGDFRRPLHIDRIDDCLKYNRNDVESSCVLLEKLQKDIELRLAIEDTYHISALNKDGVNLGMEIIKQRYLAETELQWNQIKDLRDDKYDQVLLGDIVFDWIKFKDPILQDVLNQVKSYVYKIVKDKEKKKKQDKWEIKFFFRGTVYNFSTGGIHSDNKPESIEPSSNEVLIDADVASMYPSIIIQHSVYPPQLGSEFVDVYRRIKEERIEAKHNGDKIKNETLKLALNGLSGNLQSPVSFCYSPKTALKMRINGQLMILMLAEMLTDVGAVIKNANTDGLFYIITNDKIEQVHEIYKQWTAITKLDLEEDYFERFYQSAVNDYVGVKKGWSETHDPKLIKRKGAFLEDITLGKGMAPRIIAEAINKDLVEGIPARDTILNCTDIKKFLTYQKVNKIFQVEYGEKAIQRINRYYMSTNGYRLYKVQRDEKTGQEIKRIQLSESGVTLLNTFEDKEIPITERRINYRYYLNEAYKILYPLKIEELTLF